MVCEVPLTRGLVAVVDDCDRQLVSSRKWQAVPMDYRTPQNGRRWYARHTIRRTSLNETTYMHRLILDAPKGLQIDHVDGNGLNNTRANLRLCTQSQNNANSNYPRAMSGYRGVYKRGNGWVAICSLGNRVMQTEGPFLDAIEAAKAYDQLALATFGEFATVNFPSA